MLGSGIQRKELLGANLIVHDCRTARQQEGRGQGEEAAPAEWSVTPGMWACCRFYYLDDIGKAALPLCLLTYKMGTTVVPA